MNLAQYLVNSARAYPDRKAICFEGTAISFRELDIQCNRLANVLRDLGLVPGDRCLVMMPNSIERIVVYFALAKMGVEQVVVNIQQRFRRLIKIVGDSEPKAFIGAEPHLEEIRKVFKTVHGPAIRLAKGVSEDSEFIDLRMAYSARPEYPLYQAQDDDVVNILYASLSSDFPRGIMFTHKNLAASCKAVAEMYGEIDPDAAVIGVLSLSRIYGINSLLNSSIYRGLTIELFNQFDPKKVIEVIESRRQTLLYAVPALVGRLIQFADTHGLLRSSLNYCVSEGASLPADILRRFEDMFDARIYEGYGYNEAPSCIENSCAREIKTGSIGFPVQGYKARIVDELGRNMPEDATGKLLIKGVGVMKGYLNHSEETAMVLKDGWLHTSDMARMDKDGYIYLMNRNTDRTTRGKCGSHLHEIEDAVVGYAV